MSHKSAAGTITLVIGPMFGGKSELLLVQARRARLAGINVLLVKHEADRRYDAAAIATHSGDRQADLGGGTPLAEGVPGPVGAIRVVVAARLADVALPPEVGFVGVDEGQFFPDLVGACDAWAAAGLRVVVAALDGDADRRPFGAVCELVPRSERVKKVHGVCMRCRGSSAFSRRVAAPAAAPPANAGAAPDPAPAAAPAAPGAAPAPVVDVGGAEKYWGVCRACHAAAI